MNAMSYLAGFVQVAGVIFGAPLVIGLMRQVRARAEGRAGAGVLQPWRDTRKLLGKQVLKPLGTTWVFAAAPAAVAATTLVIVATAPLVATGSPLDPVADLVTVVGLLFLGTVALTLAGIDTATAFGGMGASREITIAALVEPTILLAVFALSVPAGSTNLGAIVADTIEHPGQVISLASVLAFVALVIVIVAETGRLPVDNPSTHLELTMVHEGPTLEYAGRDLALLHWSAAARTWVVLVLAAEILVPHPGSPAVQFLWLAGWISAFAVLLAVAESVQPKMRLLRVPVLLYGGAVIAMLGLASRLLGVAA